MRLGQPRKRSGCSRIETEMDEEIGMNSKEKKKKKKKKREEEREETIGNYVLDLNGVSNEDSLEREREGMEEYSRGEEGKESTSSFSLSSTVEIDGEEKEGETVQRRREGLRKIEERENGEEEGGRRVEGWKEKNMQKMKEKERNDHVDDSDPNSL
ncbi:hypothetical protein PRIPAC_96578 [Pristionchus pacificus]|uniref:Uncharacterized protein n=1 Tax=Pristionchus pacificus TaxID=54126 RepID=A0A2A6CUB9_PRIPA|nr:hypothetical protein PRIPAC_96578 [Pristionchus pacificus]|eukprot:PDM81700.1 hypothetical protein PRIPAC_30681 [Pristionchus pacificus]